METLFQHPGRLNRGLETRQWRIYKRWEEPNGVRLVLSIDQPSVATLDRMEWRPFSGVIKLRSPFWAPNHKGRNRSSNRDTGRGRGGELNGEYSLIYSG
jgi:hypothetical protein